MKPYRDIDGDSGVVAYETGLDFIRVQFRDGGLYLYTNASAGSTNVARMKTLAASGDGLNAFINRYVRNRYARKER